MTVYLDVVFIENLIINYIILFTTGIVNKNRIQHRRLLVASGFGAGYVIVTYIYFKGLQNSIIAKLLFSICMIMIAFNTKKIKKAIKELLVFYLTTFAFGGITFFLLYTLKSNGVILNNGIWIGINILKITIIARNSRFYNHIFII